MFFKHGFLDDIVEKRWPSKKMPKSTKKCQKIDKVADETILRLFAQVVVLGTRDPATPTAQFQGESSFAGATFIQASLGVYPAISGHRFGAQFISQLQHIVA